MTFTTTEIRVLWELTPHYVYLVKNNPGTAYDALEAFNFVRTRVENRTSAIATRRRYPGPLRREGH